MRNLLKYSVLFIWAVLFLYFYNMFMPKNMFYFIVGVPVLYFSAVLISYIFKH
ncbi:putative membrane protein [Oikeobacillus pervagus]|uniref:Membrane protein n=1 Tax=Oikeobacillus pervagus TaxID=1325931 RepID=A0AAJ1T104_9BACI|nr:putative membrane protein [Oikeobacillus pervagus]